MPYLYTRFRKFRVSVFFTTLGRLVLQRSTSDEVINYVFGNSRGDQPVEHWTRFDFPVEQGTVQGSDSIL